MHFTKLRSFVAALLLVVAAGASTSAMAAGSYQDLLQLFQDWRQFERPPMKNGAPDYTAARFKSAYRDLKKYQARLNAFDIDAWPIEQQVDWHVVRAEMNGFDFNYRVLRPWARDPAFYQSVWMERSDVPAHEGPTNHAVLEYWTYTLPLSANERQRLIADLQVIPPLLEQARGNLTGNARDLWIAGIKNITDQVDNLHEIAVAVDAAKDAELAAALTEASDASTAFAAWLEQQSSSKTGPSGIGKENYSWYLRNVHLVPLSWEEERVLLKRELDRAYASLMLERHHNRNLPPLEAISGPEEFDRHADESIDKLMAFLDKQDVIPVKSYMEPALREHIGAFVPLETRNFFSKVTHYEPMVLYTHATHWFELARMQEEPHPSLIRRDPLLYNIFDNRSEGMATCVEEMFMHAGLYDDNPRVRELVWIMLAQRAARGLASLYAQANEITLAEARKFQVDWTPKGWMRADLDLVGFEQQLYLRQPGYGTSYVSGKILIERLMMDRSRQLGDAFTLSGFFDEVYRAGIVPISLVRWQVTGLDDEIRAMMGGN
jgi:uncharacterized protein (DUF885 family)